MSSSQIYNLWIWTFSNFEMINHLKEMRRLRMSPLISRLVLLHSLSSTSDHLLLQSLAFIVRKADREPDGTSSSSSTSEKEEKGRCQGAATKTRGLRRREKVRGL